MNLWSLWCIYKHKSYWKHKRSLWAKDETLISSLSVKFCQNGWIWQCAREFRVWKGKERKCIQKGMINNSHKLVKRLSLFFFWFMQTCLYNIDPLTPHFYIGKLGFTGVYIIFLISTQKHRLWYSLEPPRRGGSNEYSQSMFWAKICKISEFFCLKIFSFWRWIFLYIWIGMFS